MAKWVMKGTEMVTALLDGIVNHAVPLQAGGSGR